MASSLAIKLAYLVVRFSEESNELDISIGEILRYTTTNASRDMEYVKNLLTNKATIGIATMGITVYAMRKWKLWPFAGGSVIFQAEYLDERDFLYDIATGQLERTLREAFANKDEVLTQILGEDFIAERERLATVLRNVTVESVTLIDKKEAKQAQGSLLQVTEDPEVFSKPEVESLDVLLFCPINLKQVAEKVEASLSKQFKVKNCSSLAASERYHLLLKKTTCWVHLVNKSYWTSEKEEALFPDGHTLIITRAPHQKKIPQGLQKCRRCLVVSITDEAEISPLIENLILETRMHNMKNEPEPAWRPQIQPLKEVVEDNEKEQTFLDMTVNFSKECAFILAINKNNTDEDMTGIASVPWIKVFDFDSTSEGEGGLFSSLEKNFKVGKYLLSDTTEPPEKLSEEIVSWTIVKSSDENDYLGRHIWSLAQFCRAQKVCTMLIIWYPSDSSADTKLLDFVSKICYEFDKTRALKCILCIPEKPNSTLEMLEKKYANGNVVIVRAGVLSGWLHKAVDRDNKDAFPRFLPKLREDDDSNDKSSARDASSNPDKLEMSPGLLAWLERDLDVLTFTENSTPNHNTKETSDGQNFLQGAEISWEVIEEGKHYIKRDLLESIISHIEERVKEGKPGIIKIYHSPGSGGTTLGRMILWHFRKKVPCVALKSLQWSEGFDDMIEKVQRIRDETMLPTILLVDGQTPQEIDRIADLGRYAKLIVLHVTRFYAAMEKATDGRGTFYLKDMVSKQEATSLYAVYKEYGTVVKSDYLNQLLGETKKGKTHHMYEYGLAGFNEEYSGIGRYVDGHLLLHLGEEAWHKIILFLALANIYGNRSLPCEIFALLLKKGLGELVSLEDIPSKGRTLICKDRFGNWKITHYLVAKEILKQMFKSFKLDLKQISLEFMEEVQKHVPDPDDVPGPIVKILTSIFIVRHYKDAGQQDEFGGNAKYSRLISDLTHSQVQGEVLGALAEKFSGHAEFHAHLGRFYGRKEEFKKAIESLETAVQRRKDQLRKMGKVVDGTEKSIPFRSFSDFELHRIHSMYGSCHNSIVQHIIGFPLGKSRQLTSLLDDQKVIEALANANLSVSHFKQCRQYYSTGGNPSYGYIGEIRVRLHITELAQHQKSLGARQSSGGGQDDLTRFVAESVPECDSLIEQCSFHCEIADVLNAERLGGLDFCRYLFDKHTNTRNQNIEALFGTSETLQEKRNLVAIIKQRYMVSIPPTKSSRTRKIFDLNTMPPQVALILMRTLEKILTGAVRFPDVQVSPYMLLWLQVIRHASLENRYTVEEVLEFTLQWDARDEKGSLSVYYCYVLYTTLALLKPGSKQHRTYQEKSDFYRETLMNAGKSQMPFTVKEKCHEWLANVPDSGADRLVFANTLKHFTAEPWNSTPKLFTGRIQKTAAWTGLVVVGGIKVSFIRKQHGIQNYHMQQKEVVGVSIKFSPKNGAEVHRMVLGAHR